MNYGEEIKYYLRVARRRLGYFLVPLVLIGSIGTAIVMLLPAIFSSSAKILVESQQIPEAFVKSTVTALATERLQGIQQRVMSRENLLQIVDKFDLFANKKSLSRSDIEDLMRERVRFEILDLGLGSKRSKSSDSVTVVFSIAFDYENPVLASKVANELVTLVLNEDIQNRATRATETTAFLQRETERLSRELTDIDAKITDFKLKNPETLPEKLQFNMSLREKQQAQVTQIERDLRDLQEARRMLEFEASVRKTMAAAGTGPGSNQTPEGELAALQADYAQRSAVLSESHPQMRAMKKLIVAKQKALEEAKKQAAKVSTGSDTPTETLETRLIAQKILTIDNNVVALQRQRDELTAGIAKLEATIVQTPQIGAELAAMERRREALQRSSDEMSAKLSEARLGERMEESQQAERFEVIEAPIVPQEPSRPKRLPLMLLVAGLSLGLGGASAFGAEFLDSTIKRSSDLSRKMNQNVLVSVPYIFTNSEVRKRRKKPLLWLAGIMLALCAALAAIHFLYMPLDILSIRVMQTIDSNLP